MITSITDFFMVLCIFLCVLSILIYMNTYNNNDIELVEEIRNELKKEMIADNKSLNTIDEIYKTENINIDNKKDVDIGVVYNPNLKLTDIIEDIDNMINLVFVSELYSIEIQGSINIGTDKELKRIAGTISNKILNSISNNFRAKIYLFINENLLVEIIYSNVMRRLLGEVSKKQKNKI